jgi:two-component system CheB/CheR fusion protein
MGTKWSTAKRSKRKAQPAEPATPRDVGFPIVGVGGSAGGLEAFTALLQSLPARPEMAFVFILHLDPRYGSNLTEILARATKMPVDLIRTGMRVQRNRVYVAPPDAEVAIENGVLKLHERRVGASSVVDGFLSSLAKDQRSRAISIIMSGLASDGTIGTKAVKLEGGITFAQDASAKMYSMPKNAAAGGLVDFVLPPAEIAKELVGIGRHEYFTEDDGSPAAALPDAELKQLLSVLGKKHDLDLAHYKPTTIERRIRRRMALNRVSTLRDYLPILRSQPNEIEQLYDDILIRVTSFFRDPSMYEALKNEILPQLVHERRADDPIRVWVPGCATGEEVYSLAMVLLETIATSGFSCPIQIFGTDIGEEALQRARAGMYPESIAAEVGPERLRRFFNRVDGGYRISKAVRDCCIFARQNVTKDPPFSKLDLISCRNVMIYFGTALQRKALSMFHYALRHDGYLILGTSETIGNFTNMFELTDRKHKIYRKKAAIVAPQVPFHVDRPPGNEQHAPAKEDVIEPGAVFRDADRVMLTRFSPAGVLINEALEVLQFRGRTSRYLEPAPGAASLNILKLAREGLLGDLRAAIMAARKKNVPERREGIRVEVDDHTAIVNIEVIPFIGPTRERFLLVAFEEPEGESRPRRRKKDGKNKKAADTSQSARLRRELEATREYLQSIIEEQEAMNEELRSLNEEIQSSNEELQSTNEELETAKEELQSTNEELMTLNEELENRNQDLALANNDLINLLTAVDIPIIMLDSRLKVRRFNPAAQRLWNLVSTDVGRPLNDIKSVLQLDNLDQIVHEVMEKLEVRELEVSDRTGTLHSLRIRPYRTTDNRIDGVVIALVNLEEFRKKIARTS